MTVRGNLVLVPAPKDTMIVARKDGRLYVADFREYPHLDEPDAVDWNISISKLIVGKIEQTRTRHLTLQEIECENTVQTSQPAPGTSTDLKLTVFGSLDGKNNDFTVDPTVVDRDNGYVKAVCRATAKNFAVQLRGTYNINTIVLTFHNHGRR